MESSMEKSKKDLADKERFPRYAMIITTAVIFYGNVTYGCAMNAFSPALTDFKKKYDTETDTISIVFTASVGCYMAGALCCSFIYKVINRQLVIVFLFAGISTAMFVAPHAPTLTTFYVVGGALGFCIGCYDVAQFVWVMEMWQKESPPLIQAQHFCFAVGTMLSPLLMSPFLSEEEEDDEGTTTTTTTASSKEDENKRLFIPFTILGSLCALTAVAQLLLFIFLRYRAPPQEESTLESNNNNEDNIKKEPTPIMGDSTVATTPSKNWFKKQWPGWPTARLIILSALSLGFYQGMEMCTMALFPQFGQKSDLRLSESEAADTLTGLTGAFMIGRGVAIVLIFKIPPQFILFMDIGIVAVGNVILIAWANTSKAMLWTAGILYGLGFSSLLPSFCAYMERYLFFTDAIGAMMIVSGSALGAIYPLIVGQFIDDHPIVLSYPIFISVGVLIFSTAIAYKITYKTKNKVGE